MNNGLLQRILVGYAIGLAVACALVWLESALGHAYGGVSTSLLWCGSLSAAVLALPNDDPNWRPQRREYVVLIVSLLLLGSGVVGLVRLTPLHWDGGTGWAMMDVVLASLLAPGMSIMGRAYRRKAKLK